MSTEHSSYIDALKNFRYGSVLRPSRDWMTLLTIAGILILGSVIWNLWTFNRIASGEILGSATVVEKSVDTSTFDRVKTQFARRATEANHYNFDYHFIDPSRE